MTRGERAIPSIGLLVVCSAIGQLAVTVVVPANTAIMREFGAEYGVAQLMLTTFVLTVGVAQLFAAGDYSVRLRNVNHHWSTAGDALQDFIGLCEAISIRRQTHARSNPRISS